MADPDSEIEAVWLEITVLAHLPEHDSQHLFLQSKLAEIHSLRFRDYQDTNDLDAAVIAAENTLRFDANGRPPPLRFLTDHAHILFQQYKRTKKGGDLQKAIHAMHHALSGMPGEHCERNSLDFELQFLLHRRFIHTHSQKDIQAKWEICRRLLPLLHDRNLCRSLLPSFDRQEAVLWGTDPEYPMPRLFRSVCDEQDVEAQISILEQAMTVTSLGTHDRAKVELVLSSCFSTRYDKTGSIYDLHEAVFHARLSLRGAEVWRDGNAKQEACSLFVLGTALSRRYMEFGYLPDLDDATTTLEEATEIPIQGIDNLPSRLGELATVLYQRYNASKDMKYLERSINLSRRAIASAANAGRDDVLLHGNLGVSLSARFERIRASADLEEAISLERKAVAGACQTPAKYSEYLNALGSMLSKMSRISKQEDSRGYMNEAFVCFEKAAEVAEPKNRSNMRHNLAMQLYRRFRRDEHIQDLESAVSHARLSEDSMSKHDPRRAVVLTSLGILLLLRATYTDADTLNPDEVLEAWNCLQNGVDSTSSEPIARVRAARCLLNLFKDLMPKLAMFDGIIRPALDLLPYICNRELQREDQQYVVTQVSGFVADASAVAIKLGNAEQALQRIEHGRGLILGHLIDRKSDLAELRRKSPSLADEYEALRKKAFQRIDLRSDNWERQTTARDEAYQQLRACESSIRKLEGLETFLKPAPVQSLQLCARDGPIVIVNVTDIGSGAIIVAQSQLETISLPSMHSGVPEMVQTALGLHLATATELVEFRRDIRRRNRTPFDVRALSWLWRSCVYPILRRLKELNLISNSGDSRVWWIGSGVASSLPFHAAGEFGYDLLGCRKRVDSSSEPPPTCLDWITPSYTSTIKALEHSRTQTTGLRLPKKRSILMVTMPTTPGEDPLGGVQKEMEEVQGAVNDQDEIWAFKALKHPTVHDVLTQAPRSHIVHFACHGTSDAVDPSESHVILQKMDSNGEKVQDRLTVASLLDSTTEKPGWMVYLSACSTAQNKAKDLGDEGLHLASAFQIAGFPHAIGSLWSADDGTCVEIARHFYECLSVHSEPAVALRSAVLKVQAKGDGEKFRQPRLWAPFIHYGA